VYSEDEALLWKLQESKARDRREVHDWGSRSPSEAKSRQLCVGKERKEGAIAARCDRRGK